MVADGAGLVIAVGGDGTASAVADGLLRAAADDGGNAPPALGIVPIGTGTDLARQFGISGSHAEIVAGIAKRPVRMVDACRATYVDARGKPASRHFINIASLGISAGIAAAANADANPLRLPGKVHFFVHSVRGLLRFRPYPMRVAIDGETVFEDDAALVAVANGPSFAGGMLVAPQARRDDGLFDVLVVRAANRRALLRALPRIYDGSHLGLSICSLHRGREVAVDPLDRLRPVHLEIDGETAGLSPARFTVLPGALALKW